MMSGDWDTMRNLVDDVQLFNGDLINLVEEINAWNVDTIAFDDINEIFGSSIILQGDVSVVNFVFSQNGFDRVQIKLGLGYLKL